MVPRIVTLLVRTFSHKLSSGKLLKQPDSSDVKILLLTVVWTLAIICIATIWWHSRKNGEPLTPIVQPSASDSWEYDATVSGPNRVPAQRGSQERAKPRIAITLDNVLFRHTPTTDTKGEIHNHDSTPPCPLSPLTTLVESVAPFLEMCRVSNLFTFAQVVSDAEEDQIRNYLGQLGAFRQGLKKHRVLFSSTIAGRASMVRQLQPVAHIESCEEVVSSLTNKVHNLIHIHVSSASSDVSQTIASSGMSQTIASSGMSQTIASTDMGDRTSSKGDQVANSAAPHFESLMKCVEVLKVLCAVE